MALKRSIDTPTNTFATLNPLAEGHTGTDAAGQVIEAFGAFVIAGNFVVGIFVFRGLFGCSDECLGNQLLFSFHVLGVAWKADFVAICVVCALFACLGRSLEGRF